MTPLPPCRIYGIVSEEARRVVLFRRGPSKLVQQLVWDLESDKIDAGQWLKGGVYPKSCDLSPDGKYLVLCATNYNSPSRPQPDGEPIRTQGWTAISRPPYFTAIGLWFSGGVQGGGHWTANDELVLHNFAYYWHEAKAPPPHIRVTNENWQPGRPFPDDSDILRRHGWLSLRDAADKVRVQSTRSKAGSPFKESTLEVLELTNRWANTLKDSLPQWQERMGVLIAKPLAGGVLIKESLRGKENWIVADRDGQVIREWRDSEQLVDRDSAGGLIFSEGGLLYRWPNFPSGKPQVISDLSPNKFEEVVPPAWALS